MSGVVRGQPRGLAPLEARLRQNCAPRLSDIRTLGFTIPAAVRAGTTLPVRNTGTLAPLDYGVASADPISYDFRRPNLCQGRFKHADYNDSTPQLLSASGIAPIGSSMECRLQTQERRHREHNGLREPITQAA